MVQVKGIKVVDPHLKVDFVPVEYPEPRRIRASFKKLMQAVAPSSLAAGSSAAEKTFHKLVEQSEWLHLLQAVIQVAFWFKCISSFTDNLQTFFRATSK